jgi:hypothetical protein
VLAAIVAVAQLVPFVAVRYLPLVDLPNHEARVDILAGYGSNPAMQQHYVVDWRPVPNLAFDLAAVPLVRLGLSPLDAGRLFLALTSLLYVLGGHLLATAMRGRRTWLGVVLPLVLYSSMLFLGFLSFVFGFALFLIAYAAWLSWRDRLTNGRVAVVAALAAATLVSHLAAFGLLATAVAVSALAAGGRRTRAALVRTAAAFVPAAGLLVVMLAERGDRGGTDWGTAASKAKPVAGLLLTYDRRVDLVLLAAAAACGGVALAVARRRALVRPAAWTALAVAALYLALPHVLATATDVDTRLLPALAVLAACTPALTLAPRAAAVLAVAAVAIGVARLAYVTHEWREIGGRIERQVALLDRSLPPNADVYSLFPRDAARIGRSERAYAHVASYATIDRNAHVSRTFARRAQQPLVARVPEPYDFAADALGRYDYAWTYEPDDRLRRELRDRCTEVYDTGGFYLCRIARGA